MPNISRRRHGIDVLMSMSRVIRYRRRSRRYRQQRNDSYHVNNATSYDVRRHVTPRNSTSAALSNIFLQRFHLRWVPFRRSCRPGPLRRPRPVIGVNAHTRRTHLIA